MRLRLSSLLRDYQDAYRDAASARCAKCGWLILQLDQGARIMKRRGRCHLDNVMRCGLVWECPTCGAFIKATRAREAEAVKAWHVAKYGEPSAVMITLTVRHGAGHDLALVAAGVAGAWTRFQSGREWQGAKTELGLVGTIRALEPTWGARNGWHPHLHVAAFFRTAPPADLEARLFARWRACVVAVMGEEHAPLSHDASGAPVGVVVTACNQANYLAKLGLEITAPNTKAAHAGHYTPLDFLAQWLAYQAEGCRLRADFKATGDLSLERQADDFEAAAPAWLNRYRGYVNAMRGRRQLTWSGGLKVAAGIVDKTDEDVVAGTEEVDELVTVIPSADFRTLRRIPGVIATLLELAELYGPGAVQSCARQILAEYSDEVRRILRRRHLAA